MFALLALVAFIVAIFVPTIGGVSVVTVGLALVAAHLLLGAWPLTIRKA